MHGHPAHVLGPTAPVRAVASAAVTWIDATHALISRSNGDRPSHVRLEADDRSSAPFLARVVDEIGERERVVILGSDAMRVLLEREYVTVHHRPDRIVDVELSEPADEAELDRRLAVLTSG